MGILRTDRVSGLGGANAIKGSVFFNTNDNSNYNENLAVTNTSDLDIGAGNYTIEYWFNCVDTSSDGFNTSVALSEYTNTSSNSALNIYHYNKGFRIFNRTGGGFVELSNPTDKWIPSRWHHFAWVRSGTGTNENAIYVDGVSIDTFTNAVNYTSGQHWLIGANFYTGSNGYGVNPEYGWSGHLSNVRVSNIARYSGAFTPPTAEYTVDSNTILLACQSPSNILQEATGKEVTFYKGYIANSPPQASRFTPNSPVGFSTTSDVGSQYGSTFDGFGSFATSTYMVPPGGNTRERNRGRAVMAGGMMYPTIAGEEIDYMEIQSGGLTQAFGDLTVARSQSAPMSSSTRAVIGGGMDGPTRKNEIDFVTIASTGNATDFGDVSETISYLAGVSNQTRGLICGGNGPSSPSNTNQIEYVTIATAGDSVDFGQLTRIGYAMAGSGSPTRGLLFGGVVAPTVTDTIDYVTIASTGNATDFGNTTVARSAGASCSSSTRAIFGGGYTPSPTPSTELNVIDYVTIASTGDATDFGDLTVVGSYLGATSNGTRGIFGSRMDNQPYTGNITIDTVIIATTGNAVNWGDQSRMDSGPHDGQPRVRRSSATMSDSHGGL